jgi:hypothetical protein
MLRVLLGCGAGLLAVGSVLAESTTIGEIGSLGAAGLVATVWMVERRDRRALEDRYRERDQQVARAMDRIDTQQTHLHEVLNALTLSAKAATELADIMRQRGMCPFSGIDHTKPAAHDNRDRGELIP